MFRRVIHSQPRIEAFVFLLLGILWLSEFFFLPLLLFADDRA